jgi:hypothetical protein
MSWWRDVWIQRAGTWFFAPLPAANSPAKTEPREIAPNTAYVQVRLKSMHVTDVRRGLARFYGTVHSFAAVAHRGGEEARFNTVTTPAALRDVDAKHLDRLIVIDQPLLGPVPFRGGELTLQVGLFSIQSQALVGPFLEILGTLSKLSGVSFVSAALPFAEPLVQGINLLTGGADGSVLEIGISMQTRKPRTGYYVVLRAPRDEVDVQTLGVSDGDFVLTRAGRAITDQPYMVLEIGADAVRDDWFRIPELQKPYAELKQAVRDGKPKVVEEVLTVFEHAAITSDDLLVEDARRLARLVRQDMEAAFPPALTGRAGHASLDGRGVGMRELAEIPLYHRAPPGP